MKMEDMKKLEQELYFAKAVLGAIAHVDTPMLMYDGEKEVVKKALNIYVRDIEDRMRR